MRARSRSRCSGTAAALVDDMLRFTLVLASVTSLVLVAGCATESSDAMKIRRGDALATDTVDDHDDDDADDSAFGEPNDDPSLGAESVGVIDSTGAEANFAGNNCVVGGYYCGGDKVDGDAKTLYRCNGPGKTTLIKKCGAGCTVNPGRDDTCMDAPSSSKVGAPVPGKNVTYAYGVRNARYSAGFHTGEDYATPTGSNALAVRSGTVVWSNDAGGAYGKWIGLAADNGRTYVYCHLSSRLVAAGTKVVAGQLLAKTGATGNVTGPHLHFEDHPAGRFVYAQTRKPTW